MQEKHILETMGWQIQFVSLYNVLSHFLCQGIIFTTDRLPNGGRPDLEAAQITYQNSLIFSSMCL